jgi:N-sulfoglucosamine sulfohydrolase
MILNSFPVSERNVFLLVTTTFAFSIHGCKTAGEEPVSRPNILWITCEDMSPRLGSWGDSLARTPNIDRLAAGGVRFTNAFSVSGVSSPSRAALITGMYPTSFGAQHMRTLSRTASLDMITDPELLAIPVYEAVPPPEARTYAELFRLAGYYTTNNVKTDYQFHNPITAWDESSSTAHWRNRKNKDQPFFAVFNIMETHESRVWMNADKPLLLDPDDIKLPPYYPDSPVIRLDMAIHYSNIMRMDSIAGTILQQLEEDGLSDNTIIFFYSDHGDGLPRMKRWTYDSGLHVPLIIKFPDGRDAGMVNDRLVSFVDFAPTVLLLAGLAIPDYMHGRPFLGERKEEPREYIFAARDRMDPALDCIRTVRDRRFKYNRNYMHRRPYVQFLPYRDQMPLMQELFRFRDENRLDSIQALWFRPVKPEEELFDILADPHEIHNLAYDPAYRDIKARLSRALDEWIEMTGDPLTLPEPELVKKLWPPDGIQPVTAEVAFKPSGANLMLASETNGASIAYQVNQAIGGDHWELYKGPLPLSSIDSIAATAIRIGYRQSPVTYFLTPGFRRHQDGEKAEP